MFLFRRPFEIVFLTILIGIPGECSEKNDENDKGVNFFIRSLGDLANRIVGGREDDIYNKPYVLYYDGNCGGVILNERWAITAAHCSDQGQYIRVGGTNFGDGMKYYISKHIIHPNFNFTVNPAPYDYDFQLLEIAEPIAYSSRVGPIQIGTDEDIKLGDLVSIAGFGRIESNGPRTQRLRSVELPIISIEECSKGDHYIYHIITDTMFCAGYPEGGKDACQGDSGGPVTINDRLVGLVSFGYQCARPNSPGVFSRLPMVKNWIEENTGSLEYFEEAESHEESQKK